MEDSDNPPTTACIILLNACDAVTGARKNQHGHDMVEAFGIVANYWNAYLKGRDLELEPLLAHEICDMMELFKMARRRSGDFNPDDYVDGAGYAACAYEARLQAGA